MAMIIIKRKSRFVGLLQKHEVYLVNKFVGELKSGGVLEIPANVGSYLLSFKSNMKKFGKNTTFKVIVNEENEIVELITNFNYKGEYVVKYADNSPHIPTFNDNSNAINLSETSAYDQTADISVENVTQTTIQNKSGICCPRCGSYDILPVSEISTKGKDFDAGNACCGFLLFGPLGLLCGATGKGKQTTTSIYWMCKGCGNKFQA